ncbi:TPA: hypothetical protein R4200_003632 [Enterobacter hormaechei subsp. oharae]|nr:hypothetical protein [Enterobacter hormaechei subsp. oharae]
MNTLTKEWLLKTIAELEEERDAVPGIVNEDAAMSLAAMKIALASLEAEAVGEVIEQQSGMMLDGLVISEKPTYRNIKGIHNMKMMPLGTQFYTAPPAPTVPDKITSANAPEVFEIAAEAERLGLRGAYASYAVGWNACRAAMLQGAEPVTTAYKLRDAVETIRNSGIEIDAEKIFAERDALNAPDCWCRTCRPITLTDMRFVVCPDCGNKRCPRANDHRNACTGSNDPGQEGSAYPAAPQQEVK